MSRPLYAPDALLITGVEGRADSAFGDNALPASETCSRDDEAVSRRGARQADCPAAHDYDWYSTLRKTVHRFKGASERECPYFNEMNSRVNVLRDSVSE